METLCQGQKPLQQQYNVYQFWLVTVQSVSLTGDMPLEL